MREEEAVRFVIRFDVTDVERYKAMAAEMASYSHGEPGTLVYDWYLDEDSGEGVLYEAYRDFESLTAHVSGPVFTEIAPRYDGVIKFKAVDVYGDAPELKMMGDLLGAPTRHWGPAVADMVGVPE